MSTVSISVNTAVLVVQMVRRVVYHLLYQPFRAASYVNPAEDLEEDPHEVVPEFLRIGVPSALPEMDRLKTRPEDRQKHRPPTWVLVRGVGCKDRPENFVLTRVLRGPIPHEDDDVRPRHELAQKWIS
jgi:hypothetical protein